MYDDIEMLGMMLGQDDDDGMVGLTTAQIERRGRVLRRSRRSRVLRRQQNKLVAAKALLVPAIPGAPGNAVRGFGLGFPTATFVALGPTTIEVEANPQLAFKGARLVIVVSRNGATATGLVRITTFLVGQRDQRVSGEGLLAEAYSPNSFQTMMALDQATPGIDLRFGYTLVGPALVGTDSIIVGTQIIGATIA